MDKYDHKKIEKKWQKGWEEKKIYATRDGSGKPKAYVLDMFPYPSGEGLHVGHPKGYTATDIYSRHKRMTGHSVLHPMGWDAFGLPAENFALKNKIHPRVAVEKNIARFKEQLENIGLDYDWSHEINTTDPEFYKWTQWIFLKLHEKGLAFESYEPISWCPNCQTGLAAEDLEDGKCERCGSEVEKKPMRQWVLKITDYADRLLEDLETLDRWPEHIKEMQRNWIGRSEGARFSFKLRNVEGQKDDVHSVEVFTTRPDTLFGATFVVVSPEKAQEWISIGWQASAEVHSYLKDVSNKTEIERTSEGREKTGEDTGIKALNPATGEEVPVWVADYVLGNYGTGAIMAVPAHDRRDFEFAKKFNLPVKRVIDKQKYLIFDFDGVIGDTFEAALKAHVSMGHSPTLEEARREVIEYASNKPVHVRDHVLSPEDLQKQYEWTDRFGEEMQKSDLGLFSGFIDEINKLENVNIAIVSSGSEVYVNPAVESSGLKVTHVLGFNSHHSKEEKIESICRDWGIGAGEAYYFTDTKADVLELRELVGEGRLIGCAWGYLGREKLEEVLKRECILENFSDIHNIFDHLTQEEGALVNSGRFNGLTSEEAREKITKEFGEAKVTYRLQDWVFSRQRYWGEPIPIIHCEKCGAVPVSEKDLPVILPEVESYEPTGTGESPLANMPDWINTTCPSCGGPGKRETNTMPQWAGSSWYYLRFMDPHNADALVDAEKEKYWSPVDVYVGGAEHATRHLIYARFWHKFLFDIGAVSTKEPFMELHSVGLIQAEDGRKMSKRYGNVINPNDVIERLGADSLRVYEMFMGPFENSIAWSTDGLVGARRFIERVWGAKEKITEENAEGLEKELHKTIKKVGKDIVDFKFNTAISQMMIFINAVEKEGRIGRGQFESFIKVLAPFAPHVTEELWHELGNKTSIHLEGWPKYDEAKLVSKTIRYAVQVNGKVRATLEAGPEAVEEEVVIQAKSLPAVEKWLEGKEVKKTIFVEGRLVNFVV